MVVSLPAGSSHNLFPGQNFATRLRQEGPSGNFGVEAKFESVLTKRFQMQGIVVEQDDNSYLRFEIHHDGTKIKAYIASIINDVVTVQYYGDLPASAEHYMRVQRSGDTWTMTHSIDDLTWLPVGAPFDAEIEAAYVGPYIGTTSTGTATPPAFIGSIDYFFNVDTPIDPDDGGVGPDVEPPILTAVAAAPGVPTAGQATVTWTTNEPATTRVEWGTTTAYGSPPVIDNVAVISHNALLGPLSCGSSYNFRAVSRDASGNEAVSANQTFNTPACPAGAFSDNFDAPVLDNRWYVEDTTASSTITPLAGLLSMSVPGGQRHDLTTANRGAVRLLQPVDNSNFQVQVGFESVVNFSSQLQGVVFEQSDNTLIRFDLFSDGSTVRAFVGDLNPTRLQTRANVVVNGAVPGTLRVTRTGDNWLFEYSANDGATWQTIYQGVIAISLSRMGPMVGNANPQIASVPEHTAFVDYFWSNTDPIAITDPGLTGGPMFTIFGGNGLVWDGSPLDFGAPGLTQPDVNVLGRVLDPNGVTSITYSVNGRDPVRMGLGTTNCAVGISCTRRLANNGDFNADIDASLLNAGLNTVTIRAVDGAFNVSTIAVPVNYTPGLQFPLPYSVDWNSSPDVYERSQAIDGRWVREGDTVRTNEIGYDRLLAVGDGNWASFEAEVPVTINSFDQAGYEFPSGGPGIGFIPHWLGHTPTGIVQPKYGFQSRLGALVWYRYRNDANAERFEIRDSQAALVAEDLTGRRLSVGTTYIFKLQAQTGSATTGPTYRLKVWEAGTTEPFTWDIESALPPGSPDQGSLALVAHHVDATFGDVQVRDLSAVSPLVSPTSGTYSGLTSVTMASDIAGSTIRYTLDGSEPTTASPVYTDPFLITRTTTVKAKAFRTGFDPSATTVRFYEILPADVNRVTTGLAAEYRFDEGSGTDVRNSVPGGSALDLKVQSGSNVTWLGAQDGLRINGPSLIRTAAGAKPLNTAIQSSQSMTVEMWVDPANLGSGERTLLQLAPSGTGNQNLALAQSAASLQTALRTSLTNAMGAPVQSAAGAIGDGLHQVVYVRRPNGAVEVFVDGNRIWSDNRAGSLAGWGPGYALALGNNIARTSPWTGDLFLMAIYDDDLSATDIGQNFLAGVLPPSSNQPPTANAGPDLSVIEGAQATMAATATDDGLPAPPAALTTTWSQLSGPATAVFANPASATSTVALPAVGVYTFRWTVTDGERTTIDQVLVTVLASTSSAPAPQITPNGGTHAGSVAVTITSSLPSSEIRYTLNGADPTATSALYSAPIMVTANTTVKARVFKSGLTPSTVTSADFVIGAAERVSAGLLALYPFNETAGAVVANEGPLGSALDLTVGDPVRTTRVPSGLRLDQGTVVASNTATSLSQAITATDAFTTELWIDPATAGQLNAMVLGLSVNSNARNLGIVQEGAVLDGYLRTKATNYLGEPPTQAVGQVLAGRTHVVFTRTPQGATTLYVNGAPVATGTVANTMANWASTARLHLGGERDGSKPWLGTYYLVAMYDRALSPAEVLQNFVVGDV